jgi:hypothetical protein
MSIYDMCHNKGLCDVNIRIDLMLVAEKIYKWKPTDKCMITHYKLTPTTDISSHVR